MNATNDDYFKAVKSQYDKIKHVYYPIFLVEPSPAQLRDFCLLIYEKGMMNKADVDSFRLFFKTKEEEQNLSKSIQNFDINKFKTIQDFLQGKNATTSKININLIAIIIDFKPRPWHKFHQTSDPEKEETEDGDNKNIADVPPTKTEEIAPIESKENEEVPPTKPEGPGTSNKNYVIASILVMLLLFGFATKKAYFPSEQCMQWQEDHYVLVDCEKEKSSTLDNEILPFDKAISELRKIPQKGKIEFFSHAIPKVWYSWSTEGLEFFNRPGVHPVSGETLKVITKAMATKHNENANGEIVSVK